MEYLNMVAVRCCTLEKAEALLDYLHSLGCKWASGLPLTDFTAWEVHEENTVYHIFNGCLTYSDECDSEYHLIDLDAVLGNLPHMSPDEFYKDVLIKDIM